MDYPRTVKKLKHYLEEVIDRRERQAEGEHKDSELRAQRQRQIDEEENNYEDALEVYKADELYARRGW